MGKIIKTENAADFIASYFVGYNNSNDDFRRRRDAYSILKDEVIISDKANLKAGESIRIEFKEDLNKRCSLTHLYVYDIVAYDSISVKGLLKSYSIVPTYNK